MGEGGGVTRFKGELTEFHGPLLSDIKFELVLFLVSINVEGRSEEELGSNRVEE